MNTALKLFLILFPVICSSISMADDSPLSPAFVLKPYQVQSITSLGYSQLKNDISIALVGFGRVETSSKAYKTSALQAFRVGLPADYELSIAQRYVNYGGLTEEINGFLNPNLGIRKTLRVAPGVNINLYGAITPKTGDHDFRANPTLYDVGFEGILKTSNGLVTVLGLSREIVNSYSSFNTTSVYLGAYKEIGMYSLSVLGSIRNADHSHDYLGSLDSIQTLSMAIGRQLTSNIWGQLIYKCVNEDSDTYVGTFGETVNSTLKENQLAASLRVMF